MESAEKRSRNLKHSTAQSCIYKPHFHRVGPSFAVFLFFLRLRLIGLLRPRAVSASKRAPRRASSRDGSPRPGSRFVWHSCCSAHFGGCARGEPAIRFPHCKASPSRCPTRPPWDQAQPSPSSPSTTTTRLIIARRIAVEGPARVGAPSSEFSSNPPRRKTSYY